jgi:hypothetical protein
MLNIFKNYQMAFNLDNTIKQYVDDATDVNTITSFIDHCTNNLPYGKILVIHGTGNNGKSTFINKLEKCPGLKISYDTNIHHLLTTRGLSYHIQNESNLVVIEDSDDVQRNLTAYELNTLQNILIHGHVQYRQLYKEAKQANAKFNLIFVTCRPNLLEHLANFTQLVAFPKTF